MLYLRTNVWHEWIYLLQLPATFGSATAFQFLCLTFKKQTAGNGVQEVWDWSAVYLVKPFPLPPPVIARTSPQLLEGGSIWWYSSVEHHHYSCFLHRIWVQDNMYLVVWFSSWVHASPAKWLQRDLLYHIFLWTAASRVVELVCMEPVSVYVSTCEKGVIEVGKPKDMLLLWRGYPLNKGKLMK